MPAGRPIVVGTDGSDGAIDAVAWAAAEAALRKVPLRIVHAFAWTLLHVPAALWRMGPEGGLRAHAEELLEEAVQTARATAPSLEISTAVVTDFPLPLLVEESRGATYVVVGTTGRGAFAEALAGSMTVELVARAHAPVVVVRGTPTPEEADQLVVVGVDGSPLGAAAVEVGVEEAARRHGRLLAVHVVRHGLSVRFGATDTSAGVRLLNEALAGWREKYPDLSIEERVLSGHAAGALTDLSDRAAAVVVGARGRGGFTGMLLGSVSQSLLHHGRCPIIVVSEASASVAGTARSAPRS
ncbi:universal stress protein [Actinopolymorpha alba]|uniref:universal stress protein n=1 Tax=Actinopolymorpha alba TaxID=533267 RepID=UPI000372A67B|nr:universal stress protein [Actinopolymorpha alba]